MRYLIGIDDTDNLESRGTGHRARQLADTLFQKNLAQPLGITRHQLLVSPEIPYTSHNSSACLHLEASPEKENEIWEACCSFLLAESAPGSDAGLCVAQWAAVSAEVCAFGMRAKQVVLTQPEAEQIALSNGIRLQGLTGTHGGIIGALAGVGLHCAGNDGRFLWLPGMRDLSGRLVVAEICARGSIDGVRPLAGVNLSSETLVDVGEWVRPILHGGQAILYVEEQNNEWHILSKENIKSLSN
ncbi:MAG: ABC transporter substrate-binding protein [Chloroflexi bacterium]|nr:ABC transporter substrate-binding protein [Chloroflexota bacterium]